MTAPESIVQQEAPESVTKRRATRAARRMATALGAPPAEPERIAPEDAEELAQARAELERTQMAVAQAQEAATKIVGIHDYIVLRLKHKYRVGPLDRLNYDGTIARSTTQA